MKVDKNICDLISEIEFQIGKSCYNPNSVNGYSGKEGLEYRYPVEMKISKKDKERTRIRTKLSDLTPNQISSLQYVFGTNHLMVGDMKRVKQYIDEINNDKELYRLATIMLVPEAVTQYKEFDGKELVSLVDGVFDAKERQEIYERLIFNMNDSIEALLQ